MKTKWQKFSNFMSWVILFVMMGLLVFSVNNVIKAQKTGESAFILGHRPVLVLTGSMEPYMMTNGLALTKKVTDINELEVGDVITYHMLTSENRLIRITHRIISIENDIINTKGDNNRVADGYDLTIDNVESKVVAVFNQTAWIAAKWETTTGKIMIISFSLFFILLYVFAKSAIISLFKKEDAVKAGADLPDGKAEALNSESDVLNQAEENLKQE